VKVDKNDSKKGSYLNEIQTVYIYNEIRLYCSSNMIQSNRSDTKTRDKRQETRDKTQDTGSHGLKSDYIK
jgi:hypothetical protein